MSNKYPIQTKKYFQRYFFPFPIKNRGKIKPGMGGNFFESNQKLKLNGLTLYEKTLVCLDKLRLNS